MARWSLSKPVKEPVVPVTPIIGGSPAASKVNVYTKPAVTKADDTKPVSEIAADVNKILATKKSTAGMKTPVTVGMPTEKYADNFIRYLNEKRPAESVKAKRIALHDSMKERFSNPPLTAEERLSTGWYDPLKASDENIIGDFKKLDVFGDEGKIYGGYTKWAKDRQSGQHVFDKNLDLMELQFNKQLDELPESSKELLKNPYEKGNFLQEQFKKVFENVYGTKPIFRSDVPGGGHRAATYKYLDALNKRIGRNIPRSPRLGEKLLRDKPFIEKPALTLDAESGKYVGDFDASKLPSKISSRFRDQGDLKNYSFVERLKTKNFEIKNKLQRLKDLIPGRALFHFDHKKALMFGGGTNIDNLSVVLRQPHKGEHVKIGKHDLGMKSELEKKVHRDYMNIINEIKNKNIDNAKKISKQTEEFIKKTIDQKPSYSFIIDEPHNPYKVSEKLSESKYLNEIDLRLNDEQAAIARQLIKKKDYTPDIFKTNLTGEARFIEDLDRVFEMLAPFAGVDRNLLKTLYPHKKGGLINGHSNDTRPHMAYGGDMTQFTEMESVVPDLNPAEAGMEDYVQLAMSTPKFRSPFKLKPKPEIMSDVSDTLKITDKTKKGTKTEGTVKMEGQTPIFHLKSDLELANSPQDKMNPQQWWGYLTKRGVSETELHEFGLGNVIKNLGGWEQVEKIKKGKKVLDKDGNVVMIGKWKNNTPITKAELISQYKNNKPVINYKIQQMDPYTKGLKDFMSFLTGQRSGRSDYLGDMPASARELEKLRQLRNKPQDIGGDALRSRLVPLISQIDPDAQAVQRGVNRESLFKEIENTINQTVKQFYGIDDVLKNGIPEGTKIPFYTQNLVNRYKRLSTGEGFYMGKTGVKHEGAQFLSGGTGYIEIPFTYNPNPKGMRANEPQFKFGQGHFTNPEGNNPVFWLRASERVDERGKRVFLIEEIQSDMHQKVKQKPDTFKYAQRHDEPGFISKTPSLDQLKKMENDLEKVADQINKIAGHTDPSAVTVVERLKVKREALRNQIREARDLISQAAGKSDEVFPEGPFKKSENQAKIAIKTLINLASQEGFDSVAIITAKAKNHVVSASSEIAKGNRGFYDNIAVSGMKNVAKNLDLEFSSTNIKDGDGNTWAKIPIINLNKKPVKASVDMYKSEGGYIHRPSFVDVVPTL